MNLEAATDSQSPFAGEVVRSDETRTTLAPGTPKRLPQLDALRAFAVLGVLVHHFLPLEKLFPQDFLTLGLLSVRFFFTLSGFLITVILLRGQPLGTFYFRRAIRIFPAYYACLLIALLVGVPDVRQFLWWHASYLSNILFVTHPLAGAVTGHFWSLSVEEQFYFVWPWFVFLFPLKHVWKLALGAIVLAIIFRGALAYTTGTNLAGALLPFGCLDSLGLGALLACFSVDERLRPHRERFLRLALISGVLLVLTQTGFYLSARGFRIIYATAFLGVSLVFVWLVGKGADGKLWKAIEARPLLYTGKISYGMYLWHNFMLAFVLWLGIGSHGFLAVALMATVLTYLVAAISWKVVESPLNSLKDKSNWRNSGQTSFANSSGKAVLFRSIKALNKNQ